MLQTFGSGHSEALAMELAGRAGGLVPSNRISLRDVVVHGGESPDVLGRGILERDPAIAARLYELAAPDPRDVFVIASSSGVNGSVVEMARIVKEHGHPLIAMTSLAHTNGVDSRHPSGEKLVDHADVVLDNGAPYGDAVLPLPGGGSACAVSSITAALLAQLVTAEVVAPAASTRARPRRSTCRPTCRAGTSTTTRSRSATPAGSAAPPDVAVVGLPRPRGSHRPPRRTCRSR